MVNQKVGLQFFYIDTNIELDDKIALIEAKHGHLGFYVVIKLFVKIYGDKGYYCNWTEEMSLIFSRRINVVPDQLNKIVEDAIKFKIFDGNLYKKFKVLTSKRIQEHYIEATKRRKIVELQKRYILICKQNDNIERDNVYIIDENVDSLKQMKVNEREMKVNEMNVTHADIFNYWNTKKIITHNQLTDAIKTKIQSKLNEGYQVDEIKRAILNYSTILAGEEYYFKYKWPLIHFLQRGFENFKDFEVCSENYLIEVDKWKKN